MIISLLLLDSYPGPEGFLETLRVFIRPGTGLMPSLYRSNAPRTLPSAHQKALHENLVGWFCHWYNLGGLIEGVIQFCPLGGTHG
jgi:hypothetical protein